MESKCPLCGTIVDESDLKTTISYMGGITPICPNCRIKADELFAPIDAHYKELASAENLKRMEEERKKNAKKYENAFSDEDAEEPEEIPEFVLEKEREQKYIENQRMINERIKNRAEKKIKYNNDLREKHRYSAPVSKVSGELYCQLCGSHKIVKAGYMYTVEEKIQKYQCDTCGYAFTKYKEEKRNGTL